MRSYFLASAFWIALATVWLCFTTTHAEDWTRFRGPNGSGVSDTHPLPVQFGPGKNLVWKASLRPGNSSPVLTNDRIFLTAHEDSKVLVLCLDRRGGRFSGRKV